MYGGMYFTAKDLAQLFITTEGYVQHLASKHKWHKYQHPSRGKVYRFEDAEKHLEPGLQGRKQARLAKRRAAEREMFDKEDRLYQGS